jgi:hypothetical protein
MRRLISIVSVALIAATAGNSAAAEPQHDLPFSQAAIPAGAIARVGSTAITKATYNHWLALVEASAPSHSLARDRVQTVEFLITAQWIEGEAAERKISVTPAQVWRLFRQTRHQSFATRREFRRFLRQSKQTRADIYRRVRLELLSEKIRAQIEQTVPKAPGDPLKELQDQKKALEQFQQTFVAKWTAITFCVARYAVEQCGSRAV